MNDAALDLLRFLANSPTPYHAVAEAVRRLSAAGFRHLDEADAWKLAPGERVFVTRGGSSIAAFVLGTGSPFEQGMRLVGAHTDSPNLRLKPNPDVSAAGTAQLAVEPYGGVLFHTWLDRDLGLAGRIFVGGKSCMETVLLDAREPLLRIPSLAIHLNRGVNTEGLIVNPQKHLPPVFALATSEIHDVQSLLVASAARAGRTIAGDAILGFDLMLTDVQPPALIGANQELVSAPRLDNLASCHAALTAMTASAASEATLGVVLFDHEEVGSRSAQGANGAFLRDVLIRLLAATGFADVDALPRAMSRSLMISADMAHALHPNHADKHEPGHAPLLGGGPVLKSNVNQSYATDGEGWARVEGLAREAQIPLQRFVTRSDLGCGSTIGPMAASLLGVRTVDLGTPMLSMHSCRELAATDDVPRMIALLGRFFASPALTRTGG